eukprot:TRINITY_DN71617_c1_g1_i1.p1 TRINITY_DN71617_c1_g1~~TRINITY_DN71617_c1_g1_i1.p1  ORF type:complete len:856 (+),score=72.73 TRINITY_DN71617_c1_g1_i1:1335-3902(+)
MGDRSLLVKEKVLTEIDNCLRSSKRMLFGLDVLSIIPVERIEPEILNDTIKETLEGLLDPKNEQHNKLFRSQNAIMQLILCAECCKRIAEAHFTLETRMKDISAKFLDLVCKLIAKLEDEEAYKFMMSQKDINDRTVLEIAMNNEFHTIFLDQKANQLIEAMWNGNEHQACSKDYAEFSKLNSLLYYTPSFTRGSTLSAGPSVLKQTLKRDHVTDDKKSYWYQYKFRRNHIGFLYAEDFFFSLALLVIFQYQNYKYLSLFNYSKFEEYENNPDKMGEEIDKAIGQWKDTAAIALLLSILLGVHVILKQIFNLLSLKKAILDIWTISDAVTALVNFISLAIIYSLNPSTFGNSARRYTINFTMIVVVVTNWVRFFLLFLVNSKISPLIDILFSMVTSTIYFIFILAAYLVVSATVFMTLYMDISPDEYGDFALSLRSVFDSMFGNWSYDNFSDHAVSYSIFTSLHIIISAILLLNYLIAILSSTYEEVKDKGEFHYKARLLVYFLRYLKPLEQMPLGIIALYPAPFSSLTVLAIPFLGTSWDGKATEFVSHIIFWLENLFLLACYAIYLAILIPILYIKILVNIFVAPTRPMKRLLTAAVWLIASPVVLLCCYVRDLLILISSLTKNHATSYESTHSWLQNKDNIRSRKMLQERFVFSELRTIVKNLYDKERRNPGKAAAFVISEEELINECYAVFAPQMAEHKSLEVEQNEILVGQPRQLVRQRTSLADNPRNRENDKVRIAEEIISHLSFKEFGTNNSVVNLKIALRILPEQVDRDRIRWVMAYYYRVIQEALFEYHHQGLVQVLQHVDQRCELLEKRMQEEFNKLQKMIKEEPSKSGRSARIIEQTDLTFALL